MRIPWFREPVSSAFRVAVPLNAGSTVVMDVLAGVASDRFTKVAHVFDILGAAAGAGEIFLVRNLSRRWQNI